MSRWEPNPSRALSDSQVFDDSDIDRQLATEAENRKQEKVIRDLQAENTRLRSHYDQAVSVSRGIEHIHEKNAKLASTVRSLTAENSDLQRRLEIAARANEELSGKLAQERKSMQSCQTQDIADREREIVQIKRNCSAQIETLELQIETLQTDKEKQELRNRSLDSKIEHLLANARQFFGKTFGDIDGVCEALAKKPKPVIEVVADPALTNSLTHNISKLKSKVGRLRSELRASNRGSENLAAEKLELERALIETEQRWQNHVRHLESRQAEAERDLALDVTENLRIIQELSSKTEVLERENAVLKRKLRELHESQRQIIVEEIPPPVSAPQIVTVPDENQAKEIEKLEQAIAELNQQLAVLSGKNIALEKEVARGMDLRADLEATIDNQRAELALQAVATEQLQNRAVSETKPTISKRKLRKLTSQIDALQDQVRSQTGTIHDMTVQRDSSNAVIVKLQAKLATLKSDLKDATQRLASVSAELNNAKTNPAPTAEDIMPIDAWRTREFEPELGRQIDKISSNTLLQPPSKLAQVYSVIASFYSQMIGEYNTKIKGLQDEDQREQKIVDQFLFYLTNILAMHTVTLDDLVNQGCGEIIIEKIRELLQKNELLMKVSDSYAQLSEQIASQFGGGANPQTSIAALKAKVDNQADQIQEQTGELRENREQIQTLHADKLVLEETVSEQQKSIAQMGNDVERLKADILLEKQSKRDMQQSFVQAANLDKAEHERVLHDLTREFESTQRQSQGLIAKLSSELSSAASRVAEQKLSIARLQKELNATRQEATDRSEEVIALESSRRSECDLLASRERAERDSLISQHESQVRGLREQCETLKMELSHRSGELEHARKDRTQVKEAIGSLKHSKSVLEGRLSALSQHSRQQAKIARKSVSEAVSSTQIHFGQRIEDLTAQFDGERQRIFGFAADQFRSLYNGTEPPDENSYRAVIGDAAKELKRLSDADTAIRRLVGARSKQTTEQAVSNRLAAAH